MSLSAIPRPKILILSEKNAVVYAPSGREVCISITGPSKPLPTLSEHFVAVLRLAFSDITEPLDHEGYLLFNADHAREIVRFVRGWQNVDRLVIHCQAGLSRSPGIALGLCDLFSWDAVADAEYPLCNKWVRGELVRVGREMLKWEQ